MLSEALQRNAKHEAKAFKHLWLFRRFVRGSAEILRFVQNDTECAIACTINCGVSAESFHCGNERTGLVPVGALLVGVGDLQNARFIERFAQELQSDWQPMSIHFG